MNGIRVVDVSTSIAQDDLLPIGSDKFGTKQAIIGVVPITGGALEFLEITAENWGNRIVSVPNYSDPAAAGAAGVWAPPIYPELQKNAKMTIKARQDSVGAEVERALVILQIADENGQYPAHIQRHLGELHTQFVEGVAGNGAPAVLETQSILNEVDDDKWMALMGAVVGDTPGIVRWTHPKDEGFPSITYGSGSPELGLNMFQPIPVTNPLNGADDLKPTGQDDSGSAMQAWLYTGRIAGGRTVLSNRSPFGL